MVYFEIFRVYRLVTILLGNNAAKNPDKIKPALPIYMLRRLGFWRSVSTSSHPMRGQVMARGTYSVQCDHCGRTTKEWQMIGGQRWCKPCVKEGTDYLSRRLARMMGQ